MILPLITLFLIKLGDSILGTLKSVFTFQGRKALATIAVTGSQLMYLLLITQMMDGILGFIAVGLAVMLGQIIGMSFGEKLTKEQVWKLSVSLPREKAIGIAKELRDLNIPCQTIKTYVKEPAMTLIVYAETKSKTELVKGLLPKGAMIEVSEIKKQMEV